MVWTTPKTHPKTNKIAVDTSKKKNNQKKHRSEGNGMKWEKRKKHSPTQ